MLATDSTTEYFRNNLLRGPVLRVAAVSLAAVLLLTVVAPVVAVAAPRRLTNQDRNVTTTEVGQALRSTTGVLEASDQTKVSSDADSALVAVTAGATIDVAKDAKRGVAITSEDGQSLTVSVPNAAGAAAAQEVAPGTVSYPSANGSANAIQTTEDGSVRMLTVIDNPGAPTRYDYKVSVPNGGQVKLTSDGGAVVLNGGQQAVAVVDKPWAKDANGTSVKTWFTTNGKRLTQHVKHNIAGVAYPVTADPTVRRWYGWDFYLNRRQTNNVMTGMGLVGLAGAFAPNRVVAIALGGAFGATAYYANWAYNNGGCLRVSVAYNGSWWVGHYYGGSCR